MKAPLGRVRDEVYGSRGLSARKSNALWYLAFVDILSALPSTSLKYV